MDRNTVIGLTLIGALLVVFTYMSQPSEKEVQAKQKEQKELALQAKKEADSLDKEAKNKPRLVAKKDKDGNQIKDEKGGLVYVNQVTKGDTTIVPRVKVPTTVISKGEIVRLESEKLIVDFSTKGGVVSAVQLKEFESYMNFAKNDGKITPLYLFKDGDQKNQLIFNIAGNKYATGNKEFEIVSKSKHKVVFRHDVAEGSIIYTYNLKGGYDLGYTIQLKDLNGKVLPNSVMLDWQMEMLRSERLLSEQRKVSTICYESADGKLDWNSEVAESYKTAETDMKWVAYKQSYFSSILNADNGFKVKGTKFTSTNYKEGSKEFFTHIRKYRSKLNLGMQSVKDGKASFSWYFGPNDYHVLASYNQDYDDILNLGWGVFRWINLYAVQPVFTFFMNLGINAGLAILLLTIILKLVLMPVQWKMFVSSAKMKILKPQIDDINAKYPKKEDAMKKQMDMMALYRASGASPLAGCVPMLFQMPILLAVFRFFPATFDLRQRGFLWAEDLSSFDSIWDFGTYIPLYGNHVSLFTLLMAGTTLLYTHLNSSNMTQQQQPGMPNMKIIMYMFPFMMIFFFNNYSSGLSYYYFISTLMTIILMFVIKKFFVNEEKLKAKMAEAQTNSAKKGATAPKKKSSFMQRLEDAQRQQQENAKNKKK
ncbi:membrane protein insertase YidC [Fluviicola taffensis]|uniref:Membrane protein insertase YidC n=1 Tax=Fluviicola taffensis (strain DSM 16823 / NCIMB 13979 / RW262) TaxID=755732 RepID=F2ID65_FLUTR|nr:membrane protein insertase YidC [Fluviicola taffensis]AEA45480.1 Membrane protein oxaA [Fluviicola taffensis DSM 16823]